MDVVTSPMAGRFEEIAIPPVDPPINVAILSARCIRSAPFALSLLDELERHGQQQVDAIVLQSIDRACLQAAESAHSLRGAASIIGAEVLRDKASQVEEAGRTGNEALLLDLARELRCEMTRCLDYLPVVRAELLKV